jgi:uncharacterized membrane protein
VGIGNHEHRATEYTVVATLQRVDTRRAGEASVNDSTGPGNVSISVLEAEELARFDPELEHDEAWLREHDVTPTLSGENLRLTYLLYRGSLPEEPGVGNAYREVNLWVNVSRASG